MARIRSHPCRTVGRTGMALSALAAAVLTMTALPAGAYFPEGQPTLVCVGGKISANTCFCPATTQKVQFGAHAYRCIRIGVFGKTDGLDPVGLGPSGRRPQAAARQPHVQPLPPPQGRPSASPRRSARGVFMPGLILR